MRAHLLEFLIALTLALCLFTARARAQRTPYEAGSVQLQSARLQLAEQRLNTIGARQTAGLWLLGFGVVSAAGGGLLAGFGHDKDALLAAGITTASFGVVNALLSFGLMDLSGAQKRRALDDQLRGDFRETREAELVAQLGSAQFFALNTGLDVFYLATGALLCVIAAVRGGPDRWELGVGSAVLGQGAFLFTFDLMHWIAANQRADAARAL